MEGRFNMSIQLEKLRCTHCGAPLPQPKQGESFIKCEYCGFLNRINDTTAYVDQLKNEIAKWLSQILPQQTIVSTTADPIARHHIFQGYVKPNLIVINTNAKTSFIQTTHKSLIVFNPVYMSECVDPRSLFERSILVDGVAELAVAEEDKLFLDDTKRNLLMPAYLCNAIRDASEEKFAESIKNIDEALALAESSGDKALISRLKIAKTAYTSLRELYERNPLSAYNLIQDAERLMGELLNKRDDPSIAKYLPALEVEGGLVKLFKDLAEVSKACFENGLDPLTPLVPMKKAINHIVRNAKIYNRPFKDILDVVGLDKKTLLARLGRERVKVLGGGNIYLPFYMVSANITYTSGLLFKKGLETKIDVLISAVPPILSGLTDVFSLYSNRPVNIEKEQELVKSVSLALTNAREDYLRSKAVLPLISHSIADAVADKYMEIARSKYSGKIKLSTTQVREIVFIGVQLETGYIKSPVSLTIFSSELDKLNEVLV